MNVLQCVYTVLYCRSKRDAHIRAHRQLDIYLFSLLYIHTHSLDVDFFFHPWSYLFSIFGRTQFNYSQTNKYERIKTIPILFACVCIVKVSVCYTENEEISLKCSIFADIAAVDTVTTNGKNTILHSNN